MRREANNERKWGPISRTSMSGAFISKQPNMCKQGSLMRQHSQLCKRPQVVIEFVPCILLRRCWIIVLATIILLTLTAVSSIRIWGVERFRTLRPALCHQVCHFRSPARLNAYSATGPCHRYEGFKGLHHFLSRFSNPLRDKPYSAKLKKCTGDFLYHLGMAKVIINYKLLLCFTVPVLASVDRP